MTSMRVYTRLQDSGDACRALDVEYAGRIYRPAVEHCTLDQRAATRSRRTHAHPIYHVVVYTRGEGAFLLCNKQHRCAPGVLAIASPGDPHSFSLTGHGQVFYSEMTFSFVTNDRRDALCIPIHALLAHLAGMAVEELAFPVSMTPDRTDEILRILTSGMDGLEFGGPLSPMRIRSAMLQLFEFLLREFYLPEATDMRSSSGLCKARTYMERRYAERLAVDELARLAGMSLGYFHRAYRRRYGQPPMAYRKHLQIEAAKTLLRTTGLRGKEIAARVGFGDEYYFSRAFRKFTGETPTQYRLGRRAGG